MLSQIQKEAIKYLTPPKGDRGMTKVEWCETFGQGLSNKTLDQWEFGDRALDKEFQAALEKSRESFQHNPNYASEIARAIALIELTAGATQSNDLTHKRGCLKEIMKWTKDVVNTDATVSFEDMSDEQLIELMLGKKLGEQHELAAALEAVKTK